MEISNKKISVIVPVYNVEPYLCRCVDSILAQTFTDFELILVDDGSPDNCGVICDEYAEKDSRVTVIHKENGGLSDARNAGLDWTFANSNSEWITFIDSDDWVHPEYLNYLYRAVIDCKSRISVCGFEKTTGTMDFTNLEFIEFETVDSEKFYCRDGAGSVVACAKLFKKAEFANIRFPVGRLHEDAFTIYKILFNNASIVYISFPLYYYYNNENSITKGKWKKERFDEVEAFSEQIFFFKENGLDKAYITALYRYITRCTVCCYRLKKNYPDDNKLFNHYRKLLKRALVEYLDIGSLSDDELSECRKIIYYKRIKITKFWKRKVRHFKEFIKSR